MYEVVTMSQRTLGKASKKEMLTKIRAVTKIKSDIFFQNFQKIKNMEKEQNTFLTTKPDYFALNHIVCMRNSYEKYENSIFMCKKAVLI